jgi:hypothetical protein
VQYGSTIEGKRREDATLTATERVAWTVSKASEKVRRHFAANFGQFGSGRR